MAANYSTIEQALEELRAGHLIMVIDDPDRENEGDLICAAQFATTQNVNFMAAKAKGLICTPMSEQVAKHLGLEQMVKVNTDNHHTAFTVSIDHVDTTTGISAEERGLTCRKCVDPNTRPEDLRRPGHVFPLIARRGGVLTRNGHTEATVDLHGGNRLVLADDTLVEFLLQVEQFLTLALHHTAHWYARPAAHYLGDVVGGHLLTHHGSTTLGTLQLLLNLLDVVLESHELGVANLSHTLVVALTLLALSLKLEVLHLLLVLLNLVDECLLAFPFSTEVVLLVLQFGYLLVELGNLRLVVLTLDGLTLNLQLLQVTSDLVQLLRHRVTLHTKFGCCLIHQVDRLVWEESIRDVTL